MKNIIKDLLNNFRGTFEIYKTKKKEYAWRLKASNNQIIATSGESYVGKSYCKEAVKKVRAYSLFAKVVEVDGK